MAQEQLKQFATEFNIIYAGLYYSDKFVDYSAAVSYFDNDLTAEEKSTLAAFINYRQDCISSDREAAAFVMTIRELREAA